MSLFQPGRVFLTESLNSWNWAQESPLNLREVVGFFPSRKTLTADSMLSTEGGLRGAFSNAIGCTSDSSMVIQGVGALEAAVVVIIGDRGHATGFAEVPP